jgi:hypothetical protein
MVLSLSLLLAALDSPPDERGAPSCRTFGTDGEHTALGKVENDETTG